MNPPDSQPQPQKKRSYQNSTENQRAMQQERNRQYRKRCKMAAESLQLEFDNLRQLHMITSTELQEKQEVLELQREIMNLNEAIRRRESNWQHRLQLLANQARGTQPLVSPAEQSNPEHQRTTASVVILHCLPLLILPPLPQRVCFVPCSLGQSSLSSSSAPPFAVRLLPRRTNLCRHGHLLPPFAVLQNTANKVNMPGVVSSVSWRYQSATP